MARLLANALAMALGQARVARAWAYGKNVLDLPQMRMRTTIGTWTSSWYAYAMIFHTYLSQQNSKLGVALGAAGRLKHQWL